MTPNSSTTSYITVDQFLRFKDIRVVGQLVSDTNQQLTKMQLELDPNVAAALSFASGELESAVLTSNRYSVADLQSIQGQSLFYMLSILSDIAIYTLYSRRGGPRPADFVVDAYKRAMEVLNNLRQGIAIFAFSEVESAGNPSVSVMQQGDWAALNLLSWNYHRSMGCRNTFRPRFAGGAAGSAGTPGLGGGCGCGGY